MNAAFAVTDLALQAADQFESFLFSAATAHTNGFKSVWSMWGQIFMIAGAAGGAVTVLAALETALDGDPETKPDGGSLALGVLASCVAMYVTNTVYRERMFVAFTGSGTMKFKLTIFVGCMLVPAVTNVLGAEKGKRKSNFVIGAALGTLVYILVGCIPVIVKDAQKESQALTQMRNLFDKCYPWNESVQCDEPQRGFVKVWTDMVPDWIANTLRIKEKENLIKVMDVLVQKQKLDAARAIFKTPLFTAFFGSSDKTQNQHRNGYGQQDMYASNGMVMGRTSGVL